MFFNTELAYSSFSAYENQIFEESSELKVKKLQEVFSGLGLYTGIVDGKYDSIKESLLAYQKKAGIIEKNDDHGAGYFGDKTIVALENEFGDKFLNLKETYLKIDEPSLDSRYFYVTAYYSPLPGQDKYTTGSYEGDIRLNGGGKRTASGKGVFAGLMAAPRNYAYGTKIYLEGIGVGSVEDRGGAIVNSGERGHEYDRIDVWMGYGDEGLQRALKWGTRKVKGQVVNSARDITIEFNTSIVAKYNKLVVNPEKLSEKPEENTQVMELQQLLKDTNLYNGVIDGDYSKVKNILIKYQLENGVIDSEYNEAAGYFGEKTYAVFRKDFGVKGNGLFIEKYIEAGDYLTLSQLEKDRVNNLKTKLDAILEKKYRGNHFKIYRFKNSLRSSLDEVIPKLNNDEKKNQLTYLREIL
ncbi:MAG: 3D domain-containing protein [Candidatus Gracilibacteria bacterium]|nr:3D domain-containing protein [Candidatus Gracilibacteria bacterium]